MYSGLQLFKVNGGGQYTLNDLLNSEQKGITGEEKLSAFSSGAISGEEVWFADQDQSRG